MTGELKMKATRLVLSLMFLLSLFLLSGCGSSGYSIPAPMEGMLEGALAAPYNNFPNTLAFGKTHDCRMYEMPAALPSIQDFKAHYQAEMEKQGWTGDPTEVTEMENKLIASWVDANNKAGMIVVYSPELWTAIVCVGNP
jgi:hypothetical protein